jgi:D-alanyl-D-alanine dipeptidase
MRRVYPYLLLLVLASPCVSAPLDDLVAHPPATCPARLLPVIGRYGEGDLSFLVREAGGRLEFVFANGQVMPLAEAGPVRFEPPGAPLARRCVRGDKVYERVLTDVEAGRPFRVTPVKPLAELREAALRQTPPAEAGPFLRSRLVQVDPLDPTIRLDLRYATANNFLGAPFYSQPRAFLQLPAALAVARAAWRLRPFGFGLLIQDAYRPWYVTWMFWEATPPEYHDFVADPATGSRHNRGAAVDLTLYDLAGGASPEMPSTYDEFSERAYPRYQGGTSLQRWHREILRLALEEQGYTVNRGEWWHFDYNGWQSYPIGNATFEELLARGIGT